MLNFEIAYTDAHTDRPARPQGTAPQRQTPTDTRPAAGVTIARTEFASTHLLPKPGADHTSVPGPLELDRPGNVLGTIPILLAIEAVLAVAVFSAWCWVAGGR